MSIFDSIKNAIFGRSAQAATPAPASRAPAPAPQALSGAAPAPAARPAAATAPATAVDIEAVMKGFEAQSKQKLNWRTSIVDLMKALDIDSSFTARKELAKELGYTGDSNDSASMNIWLHKQVMTKFAANGGKLPPEIKH